MAVKVNLGSGIGRFGLIVRVGGLEGQHRSRAALRPRPSRESGPSDYFTEMCSGSEEGSYLRLIYFVSLNSRLGSNKEEAVSRVGPAHTPS